MDSISDELLMSMFCSGNTSAFQVLFEKYKDKIFRFIFSVYEKDISKAEDYTQEVFIRIIRNRTSFNPSMNFSSWLYTIARNFCLNQIRDNKNFLEIQLNEEINIKTAGAMKNASELMENQELETVIQHAISSLPENLKVIFVMREIEGFPHSQIAEILNIKEGNVRTLLHRAKKTLKKAISPYLEEKK